MSPLIAAGRKHDSTTAPLPDPQPRADKGSVPAAAAAPSGDDLGDDWHDLMPFYVPPSVKGKGKGKRQNGGHTANDGDDDMGPPAAAKPAVAKKLRKEVVF